MADRMPADELDLTAIKPGDVAALGDTVLGHALTRALGLSKPGPHPGHDDTIACFDSFL